ncbi:MAG: alpha/beta hydrolase-fold protein [Clostridia bacterium]|nr:alpha/beta hydrolase-fold protein [Clostridia bacterium]
MNLDEYITKMRYGEAPIVRDNEVVFLFKGEAQSISIAGDYNGWSPEDEMHRVEGTDIWYLKKKFPKDARVDYKFVVDSNWINDPFNKSMTQGGFGYNSTLAMPEYNSSFEKIKYFDGPRGRLLNNLDYYSNILQKRMMYHIYLPPDYDKNKKYNFIYALDGREYIDLGNINLVMDYMIAMDELPPSIAVLIDPSERTKEYTIYQPYRDYVLSELMPFVESTYGYTDTGHGRTAIGVSWGGLTAIYLAITPLGMFGKVLSQSGSFWPKNWMIFDIIDRSEKTDTKFCLQTGTLNDTEEMNDFMYKVLSNKGYSVEYEKYAEGHSWGNWKGHLYEGLKMLYATSNLH